MNTEVLQKVESKYNTKQVPNVQIGDTVTVHTIIRDGEKTRIQKFTGLVIAMKGKGTTKTFTVRKISYGVGVEKVFPLLSTNIDKIEIVKHATVRRSKLYYLRDRIGKAAMKLKPGAAVTPKENMVAKEAGVEEDVQPENKENSVSETSDEPSKQNNEESTEEKKEEKKTEEKPKTEEKEDKK